MKRGTFALLFSFLAFVGPAFGATSELEAKFLFSKDSYLSGEPVFLIVEVRNSGKQKIVIRGGAPLTFCANYHFDISSAKRADGTCDGYAGGSCVPNTWTLHPGEVHTDRVLLNYYYDVRNPGTYSVHVTHIVPFARPSGDSDEDSRPSFGQNDRFEADLTLVITASNSDSLANAFAPYVKDLASTDESGIQRRAAEAIAYSSPPSEATILDMLNSPQTRWAGMQALQRLNTAHAREVLAEIARHPAAIGWWDAEMDRTNAIAHLGAMGDKSYLPLVIALGKEAPVASSIRNAARFAAARLGGADALPFLISDLGGNDDIQRHDAALALGATHSAQAVPILIDLLRSPDETLRDFAGNSLKELTLRSGPNQGTDPGKDYVLWRRWWALNSSAVIIPANEECKTAVPLD